MFDPDRTGTICECGNHAFTWINFGFVVLVSAENIGLFSKIWTAGYNHNGYFRVRHHDHRFKKTHVLSRVISQAPADRLVDHVNGNPLDNRTGNLRLCTHAQNARNKSRGKLKKSMLPKGVYPRPTGRFSALIMVSGKSHYLGIFDTPELASAAYAKAAVELHGDFARVE